MFSFAASRKFIKSLDVTNAHFKTRRWIERFYCLSPREDSLGSSPNRHMLARAPIYGSADGGRRFWKRLWNYPKGSDYAGTACTAPVQLHRCRWCCTVALDVPCGRFVMGLRSVIHDWIMNDLVETFKCGKAETGSFRYCGKEIGFQHPCDLQRDDEERREDPFGQEEAPGRSINGL